VRERDIAGYEGLYTVREDGTVTRYDGVTLKGSVNSYGYKVVSLTKGGKKRDVKLHRILAHAFIPNPSNYECVNHIDGDKLNNSLGNLEWCSKRQNNSHARQQLSLDYSEKPVIQMDETGKFIAIWRGAGAAATVVDGNSMLIAACCKGTASSAYGYKWCYAGPYTMGAIDCARLDILKEREATLIRELEQTRSEMCRYSLKI
jgi:hypothetical protein